MKDEKKAPKLRFKGFTDDWEQCKLGDVADITTGSRNHQDSVTDGKYPFFVRSDKVERLNEYDFDTRAILVPGDGRIGEIFHYYNGKFALHQRVYKVDNFNGINELFLLGQFKCSFKKHALRLNAQGTVPSLRLPMFTNWNISIPNITEQERIGSFFRKLDQTITLHEEKKSQLERLKSALLQKMFADKSGYPAVRFKGFSDEWEQRKVKDIFKITRGQVLAATETSEEKSDISPFPVYSSQTKNNGLMGYYKDYLFDTAITWTTDGANAGTVSYRSGRFYSTNVNGVLISDKGYANKAISEILNLEAWKWVSHVGNPKLMNNVMGDISIMIPSSFEEQDRLSDFLNQLDDTIALHDKKLILLKRVKQTLLQKMFI